MDIYVLDKDFVTIAVIDEFKSLIWTDRYNGYGDFELYTPLDNTTLSYLEIDNYLWIKESEHMMIVENIRIQSDVDGGQVMIITGRSMESILDRRIVWDRIYLSNKSIPEVVYELLKANAMEPSDVKRYLPILGYGYDDVIEDEYEPISIQRFGGSLYDTIVEICEAYNLGWKIVYDDEYESLMFYLYEGRDRTFRQFTNPWVIFSPKYDNLINSDYISDKSALKTITLVAGEGEGAARKTTVVDGYPDENLSQLDRRELFTDARDLSSTDNQGNPISDASYTSLLTTRGKEKLSESTATTEFSGQAETTWMFKYGEHFGMGDIVQIANELGMEEEARVTEFIISVSDGGFEAYPTFSII